MLHRYEYRTLANGYVVERMHHLGIGNDVYTVWVPSSYAGDHGTVTSINGVSYGDYASRRLPREVDDSPLGSPERIEAVDAWYDRLIEESHGYILQAYPEVCDNPANAYSYGPISA